MKMKLPLPFLSIMRKTMVGMDIGDPLLMKMNAIGDLVTGGAELAICGLRQGPTHSVFLSANFAKLLVNQN